MRRIIARQPEWIFYLCVGILFAAALFRSMVHYFLIREALGRSLAVLSCWLALFLSQPWILRRWRGYFPLYLLIQSSIAFALLFNPDPPDFFALLFTILSAQIVVRFSSRVVVICIASFAILTFIPLLRVMPAGMAIGVTLIYIASDALLAAYVTVNLRTRAVRMQNQATNLELLEANRKLREYSTLVSEITAARERNRLARDLHDSVTQSIFSILLNVRAAQLLQQRDPARLRPQLQALQELSQSSLAEMRSLITQLRPK